MSGRVISGGPKQEAASPDFRFAPKTDKQAKLSVSPLSAITGREQMQQNGGYSITSSVRARSAAGTVRLSAATTGSSRPKDRHVGAVYL
jgi:hypothetical protein